MVHAVEEPTNPEQAVVKAIKTGRLVELPLHKPEVQDPVHGSTWGPERTVRAELLAGLLTGARKPESGTVRMLKLRGARISGSLDLEAATLVCPVVLQGCFFEQPVVLKEARGESLCLHGCYLPELNAEQLTTRGNLELNAWRPDQSEAAIRLWVERGVNLHLARIGGQLGLIGATLAKANGRALNGSRLTVEQDMICSEGFRADGEVNLTGAHVGGYLDFSGATLANHNGPALDGNRLVVDQVMACGGGFRAVAEVNLTDAQVNGLSDDKQSWPQRLHLEGLTYNTLEATDKISAKERLDWLERTFPQGGRTSTREQLRSLWRDSTQYAPQPYEQLAAMYRRVGRPEDARKVLIAKQRRRRRAINPLAKVWNSLLEWTVGYGYQTWKAGIWLLVLVGLGWWIFDRAHPAHLAAAKPPGQRPWFHAGVYALDLLLPFADLGYQGAWIASGWTRWFYLGWNLAGWLLITAVVAALSGLTKRD
jgi:hypothetical protein